MVLQRDFQTVVAFFRKSALNGKVNKTVFSLRHSDSVTIQGAVQHLWAFEFIALTNLTILPCIEMVLNFV
jgi:hypothetical protein